MTSILRTAAAALFALGLAMMGPGSRAYAGGGNKIVYNKPLTNAEEIFHFGIVDIQTGDIRWGYRTNTATRGGGHWQVLSRWMGTVGEEAAVAPRGQGRFGGFGFIPTRNAILLHPLSSLKSAGQGGFDASGVNNVTMNGRLPLQREAWGALLHDDYAEMAFDRLAREADRPLRLDADVAGSTRFPMNPKHAATPADRAWHIELVEGSTRTLPDMIRRINTRHFASRSLEFFPAEAFFRPTTLADVWPVLPEGTTIYPGIEREFEVAAMAYARGEGELAVIRMWQQMQQPAPVVAAPPGFRSFRFTAPEIPANWTWGQAARGGLRTGLRGGAVIVPASIAGGVTDRVVTDATGSDLAGAGSGWVASETVAIPLAAALSRQGLTTAGLRTAGGGAARLSVVTLPAAVAIHYAGELNKEAYEFADRAERSNGDQYNVPTAPERWYEWDGYWRGFGEYYLW